jgi:hypothetical protein
MTALPLTVAQLLAIEADPSSNNLPAGDTWTLTDTASNIESLTADQITAATSTVGVSSIAVTDTSLVLNAAQADAIVNASMPLSVPSGDTVSIADTAANIATLPSGDAATLAQLSGTSDVNITVEYTVAQALALEASPPPALPSGETAMILDTAANIDTLTHDQLLALSSIGVTSIAGSDAPPDLTGNKMRTLGNQSIIVTAPPLNPNQNDGTTVITGPSGFTYVLTWDPSVASAPVLSDRRGGGVSVLRRHFQQSDHPLLQRRIRRSRRRGDG